MADTSFDQSVDFCLIDEGGPTDDKNDHGGRTSLGITQRELNGWCTIHKQAPFDVFNITKNTAKAIYWVNYWFPWCGRLPVPFDYLFFDCSVNSGPYRATMILQQALGFMEPDLDGHMGVHTVSTVMNWQDKQTLVELFCNQHKAFYLGLVSRDPTQHEFLEGWLNRVEHERTNAHALLAGAGPQQSPVGVAGPHGP